jgi:NMD protein affecting ribosome stability and mRNA decay
MKPIRTLICSCCGQYTEGRQWWNRDNGYGLCDTCADIISRKEDEETMQSCYGKQGIHYSIKQEVQ